jgi:hypothetical protein
MSDMEELRTRVQDQILAMKLHYGERWPQIEAILLIILPYLDLALNLNDACAIAERILKEVK